MDKTTRVLSNLVSIYVSAEVLWTLVHPSEPHLYEIAMKYVQEAYERMEYRRAVAATLRSIWRLPEHDA